MSLTHIETIELGSSQSSITFSSIPQDYDDLIVLVSARSDRASTKDDIIIQPNQNNTDDSNVSLLGNGSSASSFTTGQILGGNMSAASATSNTFGNASVYISNYSGSTAKSFSADTVQETNATAADLLIEASLWDNTSAITSLVFIPNVGTNFVSGTVMSLYGVTAGGDGTVTTS